MSILIKGKDPPASCDDCPFSTIEAGLWMFCMATDGREIRRKKGEDRPPFCPIIKIEAFRVRVSARSVKHDVI